MYDYNVVYETSHTNDAQMLCHVYVTGNKSDA